jgi:uncharacterized protein
MTARSFVAALVIFTNIALANSVDEAQAAYENGKQTEAFTLIKVAAEGGNAEAQGKLGYLYLAGVGTAPDPEEGAKWLKLAAEKDYSNAKHALCVAHLRGIGVSRDAVQAAAWCQSAADGGNERAMTDLGLMYIRGDGVAPNLVKARELFMMAAGKGEPRAQRNLAIMLSNGDAGYRDPIAATLWNSLAGMNRDVCIDIDWCPKRQKPPALPEKQPK